MPGKMGYFVYTANDATEYSVKIRKFYGTVTNEADNAPALGFGEQDLTKPLMPVGMKMRLVYVQDPTGGSRRAIPVGSQDCDVWDGTDDTLKVDYSGVSGTTPFNIVNFRGERNGPHQHSITNQSDAA